MAPEAAHLDKLTSRSDALNAIADGATILVGGFGDAGRPDGLLEALRERNLTNLSLVSNNAGRGDYSLGGLLADGAVGRLICSYPKAKSATAFRAALDAGTVEMELVPQGVLAERLRAGGSGVVAFYLPAPLGTPFEDPERRAEIAGVQVQRYEALSGDVALVSGAVADRAGNVRCRLAARNFNPSMARAGRLTIVEVDEVVEVGELDPDQIHIPGIVVDHVVIRETQEARS